MGCLWCGKYSRQCKTMPSGPPEFIPPFIPVTGMKCSYGKISSPLTEISVGKTEISGTEPARPLMWTHRKFYEGFRGKARSRKPGQPGQPSSCEKGPKEDFVIPPEILRADGAFSLFSAFSTLEETSASTFLDFFFLLCLDNLRLFEVVVMRIFRFSCNLSSLFKTFSNPFDRVYWWQFKRLWLSAKLANFFFKIQRCDCCHIFFLTLCHHQHVQLTVHKIDFKRFNFYLQS